MTVRDIGGGVLPVGAFWWLKALVSHYAHKEEANPDEWEVAVQDALRVDQRGETWNFVLDIWGKNWIWLGQERAAPLLVQIAEHVRSVSTVGALTRVYSGCRKAMSNESLQAWAIWLFAEGQYSVAGEFLCILHNDGESAWAEEELDQWRDSEQAPDISVGILAVAGNLLGKQERRIRAVELVLGWIGVLDVGHLHLLFSDRRNLWMPCEPYTALLRALVPRLREANQDGLNCVVHCLIDFLDLESELVLKATEAILDRALDMEGAGVGVIVEECLALSVSLRIALPSELVRVHDLFEKALAADTLVAFEALESVDGRGWNESTRLGWQVRSRRGTAGRRLSKKH